MPDRKSFRGQVAIMLGVLTMLLWNVPSALPVVSAFWVIGVYFVMTVESELYAWTHRE